MLIRVVLIGLGIIAIPFILKGLILTLKELTVEKFWSAVILIAISSGLIFLLYLTFRGISENRKNTKVVCTEKVKIKRVVPEISNSTDGIVYETEEGKFITKKHSSTENFVKEGEELCLKEERLPKGGD